MSQSTALSNDVWSRCEGTDEISVNLYNLTFGLTTAYGLAVFGLLAAMFLHTPLFFSTFLGYFVACGPQKFHPSPQGQAGNVS